MPPATRQRPVAEQFAIALRGTEEEIQRRTVEVALREHGRVMATAPAPKLFQRFVDGREGAAEDAVRPYGVIVYDYPRIELVVAFARQVLFEKSPFGRPEGGHYRDEHALFLNGAEVANVDAWRPGDRVEIVNQMPYARRIEFGRMKMLVPGTSHVYAQSAQAVTRIYGYLATIRFVFRGKQPALVITER